MMAQMSTYDFPQIPTLESLNEQDGTDVYVLGPPDEILQHNTEHNEKCPCFPEIELYYGENGKVDMIVVSHRYLQ